MVKRAPSGEVEVPSNFRTFRVLLDEPAVAPALGFDDYAVAFADIVRHSAPHFGVGIFGDWGSGKTTLMRAIQKELESDEQVVPIWFNAWRYEREEHLVVPMLDALREQLALRAEAGQSDARAARRAAQLVARAAKAFAAGVTLSAKLPAVGGVDVDAAKIMDAWDDANRPASSAVSFYHASFSAMSEAVADYVRAGRRIVVFVDDLDRCLPESALQVLESMKLFFDFDGFVFVVGLDQRVIERAVELKFAEPRKSGNGERVLLQDPQREIRGREYIKKLFQVPFSVPRIGSGDLRPFFEKLVDDSDLPRLQKNDLRKTVLPHIGFISELGSVNPRELKRLVNAYILQMKLLSAKVAAPNPDVVLALQIMTFRPDWEALYELAVDDPDFFRNSLAQVVAPGASIDRWPQEESVPQSFLRYARGPARALTLAGDLELYVSSVESMRTTESGLAEARVMVAQAERAIAALGSGGRRTESDVWSEVNSATRQVRSLTTARSHSARFPEVEMLLRQLDELLKQAGKVPELVPNEPPQWTASVRPMLTSLHEALRALERETLLGGPS